MVLNKAFLLFLRLGLYFVEPTENDVIFMASLNCENWEDIKELSIKQAVSSILLDGINSVYEIGGNKAVNSLIPTYWWKQFILEWTSFSLNTETRNKQQELIMNEMGDLWSKGGCKVMIMKGLANGLYYPKPFHRTPGDIDCFLFNDYDKGNNIAVMAGASINEEWYKHSEIYYKGEVFENHKYLIPIRDNKDSRLLEEELKKSLEDVSLVNYPGSRCYIPTPQFCAMFLTIHAFEHFLYEGMRMKQLLDWAMFLQKDQNSVDWDNYYSFCDRYKLRKFSDGITAICINNLGVTIFNKDIVFSNIYADKILHSIFFDDDYVYCEGKGKWYNRYHVVKNIIQHRWKFEELYDQSIWSRLWQEGRGLLFRTEQGC